MATLTDVRAALDVLLRYGPGDVEAANETILAGDRTHRPDRLSPADLLRLAALGWLWDARYGCWTCPT